MKLEIQCLLLQYQLSVSGWVGKTFCKKIAIENGYQYFISIKCKSQYFFENIAK